jgi:sugar phosphate isomerase/epimerase
MSKSNSWPLAARLALSHGSLINVPPPQFVQAAADAGFRQVSLRVAAGLEALGKGEPSGPYRLLDDRALQRETRRALDATGTRVVEAEYVFLTPELEVGDYRRLIEVGAELGARQVVVVFFGYDDEARIVVDFARLCDLACAYGLTAIIEFVAPTSVNSIEKCGRIITASARANTGILVDALHLFRTGGSVDGLAAMKPDLIVNCQLSDGLMSLGATWQPDMPKNRMHLGDGDFPLRQLVAALLPDVPVAIEVPSESFLNSPMSAGDKARFLMQRAREYFSDENFAARGTGNARR